MKTFVESHAADHRRLITRQFGPFRGSLASFPAATSGFQTAVSLTQWKRLLGAGRPKPYAH